MLKPVIAATAVLAIAGTSLVYAQQGPGGQPGFGGGHGGWHHQHHHRPSAQDLAAYTDARIAALKAGLELTPDQAKNWPAFEQALRDMAQLRAKRIEAREARAQNPQQGQAQQGQGGPFDRLGHRADRLAATSAALKKVAETGAPLYQSLNDAQKERFKTLARMLRPHHRQMAFNNNRQGGWGQGRGFAPNGQGFGHHRRFGENNRGPGANGDGNGNGGQGSQL